MYLSQVHARKLTKLNQFCQEEFPISPELCQKLTDGYQKHVVKVQPKYVNQILVGVYVYKQHGGTVVRTFASQQEGQFNPRSWV